MLEPHVFGAWTASIEEKVHAAFSEIEERDGRLVAVLGGHGDLDVQMHFKPDGLTSLSGVTISGFRIVRVPRVWDDPDRREAERSPKKELGSLARTFKATFDEWMKSVSELATWIGTRRYRPERSRSNPGSRINPRTMMTAGRIRYTDYRRCEAASAAVIAVCCSLVPA
jgi:hypothetical protein